jgi:hypothetical protein
LAARIPIYIKLKEVKKRWGKGHEDVFPVTQFEMLWGDMTTLPELPCSYMVVPRFRGQQLNELAQLDGWLCDGSVDCLETICEWEQAVIDIKYSLAQNRARLMKNRRFVRWFLSVASGTKNHNLVEGK